MNQTTRVLKSKHNLPDDLWPEILSRLPVKSLRSVSRSWKHMIDAPNFARLHLNRFNSSHESRIVFVSGSTNECVVKNSKTFRTNYSLGFLQSHLESIHVLRTSPVRSADYETCKWWYIVSSIDGLFMLESGGRPNLMLMLWNPSIKKTLILLPSPNISPNSKILDFGLGFDPSINDYKCVRFVAISPKSGFQITAIYTLGTNSWKEIEIQGEERQDIRFRYGKRIVPFEGALFALAQDRNPSPLKLVSFDLRREVFGSTELPVVDGPDAHSPIYDQSLTMVDDGSLGVVNLMRPEGSLWILEKSGDDIKSWSWIQRYTFLAAPQFEWFITFLCLTKNREMLLSCDNGVILHNLETGQEKIIMEKNKAFDEHNALPYIESLILLHH